MAKAPKRKSKTYKLYDPHAEKSQASSRVIIYDKRTRQVQVAKKVIAVNLDQPTASAEWEAHLDLEPVVQQIHEGDLGVVITRKHAKRYINSVSTQALACSTSHLTAVAWQDAPLLTWLTYRESYLEELLRKKGRGSDDGSGCCTLCKKGGALYRCLDCLAGMMLCKNCCIEEHCNHPLHRIQVSATSAYV